MELVSIKKYLNLGKSKPEGHPNAPLQRLLEGISLHAVEGHESDLTRFRQEVSAISEKLKVKSTAEDIDAAVDFVIRAVAGYNRIAARISQARLQELQAMLAMTTETIAFLSNSSQTATRQLQTVERKLQKTSSIADIRVLRSELDGCLALVRRESKRLHEESHARIMALQEGVARVADQVQTLGVVLPAPPAGIVQEPDDPATGLPARSAAEHAIDVNISRGKEFVAAIFLVDGLVQVISRFGCETGDEILLAVTRYIEERLGAGSLFRWSGPALAAILETADPFAAVELHMQQIAALRLEKTIEKDGRFTLLPVTCSVLAQKVSDADTVDAVVANLDDFVATHAGTR